MTGLGIVLLVSLLLILVNGLYVAAEFALIGSPKASLEGRASRGDRFAARILRTLTSPRRQDEYIAASQLGITLASLGLGMYGEHRMSEIFEHAIVAIGPMASASVVASTAALALLTIGHIVLGEMMPKAIALQHPIAVARFTDWPLRLTLVLLYPIVRLSNGIALGTLRLVGIRRSDNAHEQIYTPEELQLIVEESERGGALRRDSSRIVRELFEFADLTAAQVMVPRVRVAGIPVGASAEDLRHLVVSHRRTRYAVYEGDLDHIVGMVHVKDLLRPLTQDGVLAVDDVRRIPVVPETASLDDVLSTMQRSQAHMAVVIDEHGGTAGIIGLEDIFEEVVGEIDEGVPTAPSLMVEGDGTVRAAGTVRLDELGQHFNVDLEHEDVDSVSGLVLARLGRPPVKGDRVDYGRLRLEVTATSGRGVREVRASLLPEGGGT
jgi:CBS domain containing-hemolysin-like protein